MSNKMNPAFAKAMDQKEKAKDEEASLPKYSDMEYEDIAYLALENKVGKVFRPLGSPLESRSLPTDIKFILQSKILKDDKKGYIKINWPYIIKGVNQLPDPDWVLTELYNKINEGKWVKYPDGKIDEKGKNGYWDNFHENTDIYKKIKGNAKKNEKYPPSFYPGKRVIMNIVDRQDSWCEENKHAKLLTAKESPYTFSFIENEGKENEKEVENTIYYRDTGIPYLLYTKIFDHFVKYHGGWGVDAVLTKDSANKNYEVRDIGEERYISGDAKKIGVDTDLTDAEHDYELYDLDKLFKISSYNKLKKYLTGLFKMTDEEFGTDFYDKLCVLAKKESEEWEKEKEEKEEKEKKAEKSEKETTEKTETETETEEKNEEKESTTSHHETKSRRPPAEKEEEKKEDSDKGLALDDLCEKYYLNWGKLSEKDQSNFIDAIEDFDGKIAKFKKSANELLCFDPECKFPDSDKGTSFPQSVSVCPVCGSKE